jgi:hypothetical protein
MKWLGIAIALSALAVAAQQPATQTAPPAAPAAAPPPVAAPVAGQYLGVASCASSGCHGSTHPLKTSRVLQNEYYTWLRSDRHAGSYNVLFNAVSTRIARNMHLQKKPYQEKVCLDCHSTNVEPQLVAGRIDGEDGVQCEVCHGAASGWRAQHTDKGWTHAQSVERGMIDLRDLRVRAHICDHCHVGSPENEVDHDLIASGHPILAFELDNYTESMPSHWHPNDTHGVPAWAVGQAMSFRDSMNNLAHHARGQKWPEFSDMSCTNCHHALEPSSVWRQERGWPDRAGLPAWSPQRWAVLRLIVDKAAPSSRSALDDSVAQIATRVSHMNDPAGVAAAADDAVRLIEGALPRIAAVSWSDADVRAMMVTIAADRAFVLRSDVQSAEQVALSLQSLASVLTRRDPRLAASPMMKAIDALFADLRDRSAYDPNRFAAHLDELRGRL